MSEIIGAVVFAWLMANLILFMALDRRQVEDLCRRTVDRFLEAIRP